jgi:hypothetical protein
MAPKPQKENSKHLAVFELWYSLKRDTASTCRNLRLDTPPQIVSVDTVNRWRKKYGWDARADERDRAVQKRAFEDSVAQQVDFLKRQAQYGRLLQRAALQFVNSAVDSKTGQPKLNPDGSPVLVVNNMAVAIQAMQTGLSFERASLGLPDWLMQAVTADDETLRRIYESAIEQLGLSAGDYGGAGDSGEKAFPAVKIEPVQQTGQGK